ncbi:hypothetical protein Btru_051561 [Bulinus truncatus]|nr:hypothetical protein Btru_051561 [Bulinus truncatus]
MFQLVVYRGKLGWGVVQTPAQGKDTLIIRKQQSCKRLTTYSDSGGALKWNGVWSSADKSNLLTCGNEDVISLNMVDNFLVNMIVNKRILLLLLLLCSISHGWIHNLKLQTDERRNIMLTQAFGFLKGGTLIVNVTMFSFKPPDTANNDQFGFTLEKSNSPSISSYMDNLQKCALNDTVDENTSSVLFRFNFTEKRIIVKRRGNDFQYLNIQSIPKDEGQTQGVKTTSPVAVDESSKNEESTTISKTTVTNTSRKRRAAVDGEVMKNSTQMESKPTETKTPENKQFESIYLPLKTVDGEIRYYQTFFKVNIDKESEEGLYYFYFHNCKDKTSLVNLSIQITQKNALGYLSADEMPIPILFFVSSIVFFILSVVWMVVLRKADGGVFKIHYLMFVVIFFKSISDLFHGVNMHMIDKTGIHIDAWAILWYIVYLMKGAVLFVTVLLIGAGWAFIKHVFTVREKKLFLIVIPLQILMNVAWVIVEESEKGYSSYDTWHKIFIGVDLLCCFAILFPVIWSIRHLQEASKTDGKAAINLNKLKLFRHFYIMVVAYIYFTRIIGYLLEITLPFRYGWMKSLFEEAFLLVFFTLTGYKFRPTSDNPYLQVPLDSDNEEEIELDEVITKSGSTETLVRVNQGRTDSHTDTKQRESSHEFD